MFVDRAGTTWSDTEEGHYLCSSLLRCLHNPGQALSEFLNLCKAIGIKPTLLNGNQDRPSLLFATHGGPSSDSRLIVGGLHGDEPAGVLGILLFLRRLAAAGNLHSYPPFAILPLVSPTAFGLARRTNAWHENANRGYFPATKPGNEEAECPSREGFTILENFETVVRHAPAGTLALHEDVDTREYYLYAYEESDIPTGATERIRDKGGERFGTISCDPHFPEGPVNGGIIHNDIGSGALDEVIFLAGSKMVVVSETPGKCRLEDRIQLNADLVSTFLERG
jgi:hypothetical protein